MNKASSLNTLLVNRELVAYVLYYNLRKSVGISIIRA